MRTKTLTQAEKYKCYREHAKDICVDLDATLATWSYPEIGPPTEGACDALRALQAQGYHIVIFSSRLSPEIYTEQERCQTLDKIGKWLRDWKIPYNTIDTGVSGKRLALGYVDDRGIAFTGDWQHVINEVERIKTQVEAQHQAAAAGVPNSR